MDLLRRGGETKPFDLPTEWLPQSSPTEQARMPSTPAEAAPTSQRAVRRVHVAPSTRAPPPPAKGSIVFFAAEDAPFVLGEVIRVDPGPVSGNVTVHWYGPVNREVRARAGSTTVADYAASTFSPDFLQHGRKRARTPDVSDESLAGVIASCTRLTTTKAIPAAIQRTLVSNCFSTISSEEPSSSEEEGYSSDETPQIAGYSDAVDSRTRAKSMPRSRK